MEWTRDRPAAAPPSAAEGMERRGAVAEKTHRGNREEYQRGHRVDREQECGPGQADCGDEHANAGMGGAFAGPVGPAARVEDEERRGRMGNHDDEASWSGIKLARPGHHGGEPQTKAVDATDHAEVQERVDQR